MTAAVDTKFAREVLHRRYRDANNRRRDYDAIQSLVLLVLGESPDSTIGEIMDVMARDAREFGVPQVRTGNVARALQILSAARVITASVDGFCVRYRVKGK